MSPALWRTALRRAAGSYSRPCFRVFEPACASRSTIQKRNRITTHSPSSPTSPVPVELQSRISWKAVAGAAVLMAVGYAVGVLSSDAVADVLEEHEENGHGHPTTLQQAYDAFHEILSENPEKARGLVIDSGYRDAADFVLSAQSLSFVIAPITSLPEDLHPPTVIHQFFMKSNSEMEDRLQLAEFPGPGQKRWFFFGVYDGHAGPATAEYLKQNLVPNVSEALLRLPASAPSIAIDQAITDAFLAVDRAIMQEAKQMASWSPPGCMDAMMRLEPAMSGSCALLAAYDPVSTVLRVACTGDSRAVLGRWDPALGKYVAKPLSVDQTGFNPSEVERISKEHPGEEDILDPKTGRLLGLAVTRAFGDHRWKWANDAIEQFQYKFWGYPPRPNSRTPPYLTAEPVITETKVQLDEDGQKADFLIMASDGLWDHLSSDQAVEIVNEWLEEWGLDGRGTLDTAAEPYQQPRSPIPGVECDVEGKRYTSWKYDPKYLTVGADNAAQCLVRNAWGGNRADLVDAVVMARSPFSRWVRDDTTVVVVFFDSKMDWSKSSQGNRHTSHNLLRSPLREDT